MHQQNKYTIACSSVEERNPAKVEVGGSNPLRQISRIGHGDHTDSKPVGEGSIPSFGAFTRSSNGQETALSRR